VAGELETSPSELKNVQVHTADHVALALAGFEAFERKLVNSCDSEDVPSFKNGIALKKDNLLIFLYNYLRWEELASFVLPFQAKPAS